jgi:hydrogenase/urease accessory protein HupE
MTTDTRRTALKIVLLATAAFLVFGLPFMFDLWPGGFRWAHPAAHPAYERMIIAIYVALGVCLVPAAFNPERHVILIDFTILSSLLHGAVMTYDSFAQDHEMTHLVGDVPLLFLVSAVLIWLHPRWLRKDALPTIPAQSSGAAQTL